MHHLRKQYWRVVHVYADRRALISEQPSADCLHHAAGTSAKGAADLASGRRHCQRLMQRFEGVSDRARGGLRDTRHHHCCLCDSQNRMATWPKPHCPVEVRSSADEVTCSTLQLHRSSAYCNAHLASFDGVRCKGCIRGACGRVPPWPAWSVLVLWAVAGG